MKATYIIFTSDYFHQNAPFTVWTRDQAEIITQNDDFENKEMMSPILTFKKRLYGPFLWMRFNCLKARATSRRQFTFYR